MLNYCILQIVGLITPEVAEVDIAVVTEDQANQPYSHHVVPLPLDLTV